MDDTTYGTRLGDGFPGRWRRVMQRANAGICLLDARLRTVADKPESGLATAEYAVVMIAATGFAGLLVAILKSSTIKTLLTNIVKTALSVG